MDEKSYLITEWINLIPLLTVYSEEHSEKLKTFTLLVSCSGVQVLITTKKTYPRKFSVGGLLRRKGQNYFFSIFKYHL
jgi:hypothetical protein